MTVTNGAVPASNPATFAGVGKYYWSASYSGDPLDNPSTSGCAEVETVAIPPVTVASTVHDAADASVWNGAEVTGASAYDSATVSGFAALTPTGTVTYTLFATGTCAGSPSTTQTVTLSGGGAVPNSSSTAPLGAGQYSYLSAYSGDSNYTSVTGACEPFTVSKSSAASGTVVDDAALGSAWNGTEATGAAAFDTATVSRVAGFAPTGTMSYAFFTNATCSGSPSTTRVVTLVAGSVPNSPTTGALATGAYSFKGTYSGDGNYQTSSSVCEPFSVLKTGSSVGSVVDDAALHSAWNGAETIGASAYDTATVTALAGFTPTGTLAYSFYTNGTCTGSPATTDTRTLGGGAVPNSTTTGPLVAGSYSFEGSYSGDANYQPATGACEPFSVVTSASNLGTIVDDAGTGTPWAGTETVGASAYDTASLATVAGFNPTGTVTYHFYANGTCSGAPLTIDTVTLAGGNVPNSSPTGALGSGSHGFDASYSGDGNYQATTATCESFEVFQAPAITSADHVAFTITHLGTFTITTTGYPAMASMLIDDGGATLPAGVTFHDNGDGTATLSGTPGAATSGTYPITITAANGIAPAATQVLTLSIDRPPAITSANGVTFTTAVFGTFTVDSNGFPGAGSMTLSDGGASLPAGVSFVDNGDATATLSGTPGTGTGGTHAFTITASNGVAPDATQAFVLTIDEPPTVTSASGVTFAVGAPSTFTVTMAGFPSGATASLSDGGATLPAGVSFVDNSNGTATLAGTPDIGTIGSYPFIITVTNGIAPGGTQSFTLTVAVAHTTAVLSSPTNPSVVGQSVTLIASVTVTAPSSGIPTGMVSFEDGGSPITSCASQPVSSSTADCTTSFGTAAPHVLTAIYGGDADFATSTSAPLTQNVDAAATTTAAVSSANPAVTGQAFTYTATVSRTAPATGTADGTVAFTDSGTPITGCEAVVMAAGIATCTVTDAFTGVHTIVATYSGDANDLTSTAPALTEAFDRDRTTTTVTSAPDPSTVGQLVTIAMTIKAGLPGAGNPTGTVGVFVDGKLVATVALDSSVDSRAVYRTTSLAVGVHAITATYNGDAGYAGSAAAISSDSQNVLPSLQVPVTGTGLGGWSGIAALTLLMDGFVLVVLTRRRRRQ